MAFDFRELSVTLTTSFVHGEPRAELAVKTCGDPSLRMLYATCGTDTQHECTTKPEDMKLLSSQGDPGDLEKLQEQLEEMLGNFGPDGTMKE